MGIYAADYRGVLFCDRSFKTPKFGKRNMWAAPYLDKTATLANICCWPSPISSFSSEIGFLNGPPSNLLPSGICYPGAFAQKAITKTKEELNEDAQKECAK